MDIVLLPHFTRTIEVVGEVLVAYTVLSVHHKVRKQQKIDKKVFKEMKKEQFLGLVGICLIVFSYVVDMFVYFS